MLRDRCIGFEEVAGLERGKLRDSPFFLPETCSIAPLDYRTRPQLHCAFAFRDGHQTVRRARRSARWVVGGSPPRALREFWGFDKGTFALRAFKPTASERRDGGIVGYVQPKWISSNWLGSYSVAQFVHATVSISDEGRCARSAPS